MQTGARLAKLIQDIRASYWFLPTSLALVAVLLSFATLALDRYPGLASLILPESLSDTQIDGARTLMSIISQSTFGVAGVMFSMTMVAVSFASGNFGPRLIGNFMRDRGNQWSLGILIATFVYALMITRAIQDPVGSGGEAYVPHLSIAVALVLMAVSVLTVIYFVHHIPETINVSNITGDLGTRLITGIKQRIDDPDEVPATGPEPVWPARDPDHLLTLRLPGYVQTLDTARLRELANSQNLLIEVACPPGEFVSEASAVLRIWGAAPDEDTQYELRNCFATGLSRTEHQNLLFVVQQLVEMTARALSPGVNDPFTAINCMNWLYSAAIVAANYNGGLRQLNGGRIRQPSLSFRDLLEQGFGVAHDYTRTDRLCDSHVHGLFDRLDRELESEEDRKTLRRFRASLED